MKSPLLATLGLLAVGLLAVRLLRGDLTLTQAAVRAVLVLVGLMLVERVLAPLARALVGGPKQPDEPAP